MRLLLLTIFLSSCYVIGPHKSVSQISQDVPVASPTAATFLEVKSIFENRCSQCHPGRAPYNWLELNQVTAHASEIFQRVVVDGDMPQIGSPQAAQMSQEERDAIATFTQGIVQENSKAIRNTEPDTTDKFSYFNSVITCVGCHGELGISNNPRIPNLAGQHKEYLTDELHLFKQNERKDYVTRTMRSVAHAMTERQIASVAEFYSRLRIPSPSSGRTPLVDEKKFYAGKELAKQKFCVGCHLSGDERATINSYVSLLGQNEEYLISQILSFQNGDRRGKVMTPFMRKTSLNQSEIEAIAHYFASEDVR